MPHILVSKLDYKIDVCIIKFHFKLQTGIVFFKQNIFSILFFGLKCSSATLICSQQIDAFIIQLFCLVYPSSAY